MMRKRTKINMQRKKRKSKHTGEKTQRKYCTSRGKLEVDLREKKMEPAVGNLCLIQRFKMWDLFLMPLLKEGNATGHGVHTGLRKHTCK